MTECVKMRPSLLKEEFWHYSEEKDRNGRYIELEIPKPGAGEGTKIGKRDSLGKHSFFS